MNNKSSSSSSSVGLGCICNAVFLAALISAVAWAFFDYDPRQAIGLGAAVGGGLCVGLPLVIIGVLLFVLAVSLILIGIFGK